jgi:hypothetical protein
MSKRDFELVAHILRALRDADDLELDSEQHGSICTAFGTVFAHRYPRFDRDSFFEVCRGAELSPEGTASVPERRNGPDRGRPPQPIAIAPD